jgi:hypothetical protein
MPSDYPKHMLPPAPVTALPYVRTIALAAGFFTVLALLLIVIRFVPAV